MQKTNIIRDYLEDLVDGRAFWPHSVYATYSESLADFRDPQNKGIAIQLLNELIVNALELVPSCLAYLDIVSRGDPRVFFFCAVPQGMAIASLAELYGNEKVFTGVVKISKMRAARMILDFSQDSKSIRAWFIQCAGIIAAKAKVADDKTAIAASERVIELAAKK